LNRELLLIIIVLIVAGIAMYVNEANADSSDGFWFATEHCSGGCVGKSDEYRLFFDDSGSIRISTTFSSATLTKGYAGKIFDKSEIDGKLLTFEISQPFFANAPLNIQIFDGAFDHVPTNACGVDCFPIDLPLVTSGSGGILNLFTWNVGVQPVTFKSFTPNLASFDSPTGKVTVIVKNNDANTTFGAGFNLYSVEIEDLGKYWFRNDVSDVNWSGTSIIETIRGTGTNGASFTYVTKSPFDTPPTITLNGSPIDIISQFDPYPEVGATCFDTQDGQIDGNVVIGGDTVDTNLVGFYDVEYSCTDAGFLSKVPIFRLVVIADPIIPMIEINGENLITLRNGVDTYTELGAMCFDDFEGDISGNIDIGGDVVNTSVDGTYNVTYDCFDASINVAPQIIRVVEVITDVTVPNVTGSTLNINVGSTTERTPFDEYVESCTATDQLPINPTCTVSSGDIDTSVLGLQTVNYSATDLSGNEGIGLIFTTVVDTIFADITFTLSSPVEVYQGNILNELDFITCDDLGQDITNVVTIDSPVDMSSTGIQTVTYSCIDVGSNESIIVVDFFVKKPQSGGGGSSISSGSSSGTKSTVPQLSDIPTLSFQDSPSKTTPATEGRSIADLFASLFDNRITEGITTPTSSGFSSTSPTPTKTSNPIVDFFQNLFANFFG